MPRINVEENLFSDPRFLDLCDELGRFEATGRLIFFWRVAQKYWLEDDSQGGIPDEVFGRKEIWKPLADCGLAEKRGNFWYAKGAEAQFDWYLRKKRAGKAGGKKSAELRASKTQAPLEHCSTNLKQIQPSPTPTPTPLISNSSKEELSQNSHSDVSRKNLPVSKLVCLWNEHCGSLPRVEKISKKRQEKIKARLREEPHLEYWEKIFRKTTANSFLNGSDNNRGWRASFDWLMTNDTNHVKVLEGQYDKNNSEGDTPDWLKNWVPPEERKNRNATQ